MDIVAIGTNIVSDPKLLESASIEIPKDPLNGDVSTNVAMIVAAKLNENPKNIAIKFKELLSAIPYVVHIEVAGPGFINFTLRANAWHECINNILHEDKDFFTVNVGNNRKVNIEYVSANPTGPIHIGHARGAVYGDALANLLSSSGYQVTKEYYVNDAGSQIEDLTKTSLLRYVEALTGQKANIPDGLYPGEYLVTVGQKLFKKFGDKLTKLPKDESSKIIKEFVVAEMLTIIRNDLADLGIEHEIFFSEQSLHDNKQIEEAVKQLTNDEFVYIGQLPPPKGKIDKNWQEKSQLLFKSTLFDDDQDRPLQKTDGSWAYFAADIAYAKDKIDRGFDNLVYILGADHAGYIKRINAIVKALGHGKIQSTVKICQLVNYVENDIPVKMSKRSGNFTTVRDVINEVGKDIIRFMMLTRKNDAPLDFDLQKVKEQSKDNPVFYLQYAYVRTISILSKAKENMPAAFNKLNSKECDLSLLSSEEEIQLIKLLASWPKIVEGAANHFEPHRIAFYLLSLAAKFHAIWNLGKENNDYRFVVEGNEELTAARLALVKSVQKIITKGFEIIGITPLSKM